MKNKDLSCSEYDLEKYMLPIWDGDTVYNESVLPVKNKDGVVEPIALAYEIDEICEVRSSDLKTVYREELDYTVENGMLCIKTNGNIPAMEYGDYYPDGKKENVKPRTGGGNILFIEGGYFHTKQIAVTYTHKDKWGGKIPESGTDNLARTMEKLKNKQPLHMAFFGDSIYTGCNSSGTPQGGDQAPFMPSWYEMVTDSLKKAFGYGEIDFENHSRGGRKSFWIDEAPDELFDELRTDLAWIGYGMNDRETTLEEYGNNISKIMQKIRKNNPECDFILTAPMLASKEAEGFYRLQYMFVNVLNGMKGQGVSVMDVTSVHGELLKRKSYRDMTGNNLNHPNDFLCRMYAQTAFACFFE